VSKCFILFIFKLTAASLIKGCLR